MWLHDEQREIPEQSVKQDKVQCGYCGNIQNKYIVSWYSGEIPCAIKAGYCGHCGVEIRAAGVGRAW